MKRVLSNINFIVKLSLKYTGMVFALFGFIEMFAPLSEMFDAKLSLIKKIGLSCLILFAIWLMMFLSASVYVYLKKRYEILNVGNGHHVYVQYGDIFSSDITEDSSRNIVIPVNRCFDTIIDDDLVSSRTLHGISMNKIYANHIFTPETLNEEIQKTLLDGDHKFEEVDVQNKKKGNLKRFEAGTVVEIKAEEGNTYFFLALTTFDKDFHAHTEDDQYVLALIKMLMYNNHRSQGRPLLIPLIGAGAADTKKDERDILEYIVKLIKMNKKMINCDVHIVVRNSAKDSLAITNL